MEGSVGVKGAWRSGGNGEQRAVEESGVFVPWLAGRWLILVEEGGRNVGVVLTEGVGRRGVGRA